MYFPQCMMVVDRKEFCPWTYWQGIWIFPPSCGELNQDNLFGIRWIYPISMWSTSRRWISGSQPSPSSFSMLRASLNSWDYPLSLLCGPCLCSVVLEQTGCVPAKKTLLDLPLCLQEKIWLCITVPLKKCQLWGMKKRKLIIKCFFHQP